MKCILSHTAAYVWFMRHACPELGAQARCRIDCSDATIPCDADVHKMRWFLDLEDIPLDFLVGTRSARRQSRVARSHLCMLQLPARSFIPIACGLDGIDLYCPCPELCFLELCQQGDVLDAIFRGMALGAMSMNPKLTVFDGRNPDGSNRVSERYPDILVVMTLPDGSKRMVAFDYDSQAEHQSSWKVLMDSRRRNALATIESLTHYAIRKEDAQDYEYMVLLGNQARKALGLRPWPQVRRLSSNEDAKLKARRLDMLRFELWERFVRSNPI